MHPARALLCSLLAPICPTQPAAHEQEVHCRITKDALPHALRFRGAVERLGLDVTNVTGGQAFVLSAELVVPRIGVLPPSVDGLVMAGAVLEDGSQEGAICDPGDALCAPEAFLFETSRPVHHFMDPEGAGLLRLFPSSYVWSKDHPENHHDWRDAVDYFESAMLEVTLEDRAYAHANLFVALGCNLHLVQDLTSPAHTRDDLHPGHHLSRWVGDAAGGWVNDVAGSSLHEDLGPQYVNMYTNAFAASELLIPERLGSREDYFFAAARWTNEHFFSDDTIEEAEYPLPFTSSFLSPTPDCASNVGVTEAYRSRSGAEYGGTMPLARERSVSWWPTPTRTLLGSPCVPGHGSTGIVRENLALIIPTATSLSAGLLDYFFRARLDCELDEAGDLHVVNSTDLPGLSDATILPGRNGSIAVVLERADRSRVTLREMRLSAGGLAAGAEFVVPGIGELLANEGGEHPDRPVFVVFRDVTLGGDPAAVAGRVDRSPSCERICIPGTLATSPTPGPDFDGDGYRDVCVPYLPLGEFRTRYAVYSGRSCSIVADIGFEEGPTIRTGAALVRAEGTTGWGRIAILQRYRYSDPQGIALLSGADLSVLWEVSGNEVPELAHAGSIESCPDLDSDGHTDILCRSEGAASMTLLSGASGHVLAVLPSFTSIYTIEDLSSDGVPEVVLHNAGGPAFQGVTILDGASYDEMQWPLEPGFPTDWDDYYSHIVLAGFDPDLDGASDALGAYPALTKIWVAALSTTGGRAIWTDEVPDTPFPWLWYAGDYDADGSDDAWLGNNDAWLLYSAQRRTVLRRVDSIGFAPPTWAGDLNGDGASDYLYSSLEYDCIAVIYGSRPE